MTNFATGSGPDEGDPATDSGQMRVRRLLIALLFFGTIINYIDRQVLALLKPTFSAE